VYDDRPRKRRKKSEMSASVQVGRSENGDDSESQESPEYDLKIQRYYYEHKSDETVVLFVPKLWRPTVGAPFLESWA